MHYHSFVGEIACGRWSIAHNRHCLWGKYFYWVFECTTIKAVLVYTGSIHQLRRWYPKLFTYDLSITHRPTKLMKDVDACSRHMNTLIYCYLVSAYSMRYRDIISRPYAYSYGAFRHSSNHGNVKVPSTS